MEGHCSVTAVNPIDVAHILPHASLSLDIKELLESPFWHLVLVVFGIETTRLLRVLTWPKDQAINTIGLNKSRVVRFRNIYSQPHTIIAHLLDLRRQSNELNWTVIVSRPSKDIEEQKTRTITIDVYAVYTGIIIWLGGPHPHPLILHSRNAICEILRMGDML